MGKTNVMIILVATIIGLAYCSPGSDHHLDGSEEARMLFHLADKNADLVLNMDEMHSVFLDFDLDGDGHITSEEFVKDWMTDNLGTQVEAVTIFNHLDVDHSGFISEVPDVPFIFKFFDRDYNGTIDQTEFVVQWIKIKNTR